MFNYCFMESNDLKNDKVEHHDFLNILLTPEQGIIVPITNRQCYFSILCFSIQIGLWGDNLFMVKAK
ncbi:hypothetical protein SAMN04489761_3989 [Tenacibaculum sp. MAR_2009_124]|nr:hypothetical protein SAMN04489761_3989 [Tenacibaculum sp. MAR_2009_124]